MGGKHEKPINKNLGKSFAFKASTRTEIDHIMGPRPAYEKDFINDLNRYKIKY